MTPQSCFMIVAPLAEGREAALAALLDTMNRAPGVADPGNGVIPFQAFRQLHFARLVVVQDPSRDDVAAYHLPVGPARPYLAFMGDCDGPSRLLLQQMANRCGDGIRRLFGHCEGFDPGGDVGAWLLSHCQPVAASYVNTVGRTVVEIKEDSALQRALSTVVDRRPLPSGHAAQERRGALLAFVAEEVAAGRLSLTPAAATPVGWQLMHLLDAVWVPLAGLLVCPLLLLLLPVLIGQLRLRESTDPQICPPPDAMALLALQTLEDRDVSNQYTAIGGVKPGLFRRWLLIVLLRLTDYGCRHVYTEGFLARVQTIHFAHWIFLDNKTRVVFTSNYDGLHEAYMDDFINKVSWGLNVLFSNGIGWPRTDWLVFGGAQREMPFKYYQRRHQIPSQVWYKAYPGLTLADMARNRRIREGIQRQHVSDDEALAWLQLL